MTTRMRNKLGESAGFTLLEVMVAITILLLVILPLASLYVRSLTVIQNAALYSQAIQLAQERMEVCAALDYDDLYYFNENFTPGFPYRADPLPVTHRYDGEGAQLNPLVGRNYDNRDIPDTDQIEYRFDPTDCEDEHVPVPVYRDYYNNYTGRLLDPNFNGLCDDDLDGDGEAGILADPPDLEDIEIATNGLLRMYTDSEFSGTPVENFNTYVPGDGLYDTVVEGLYVTSMDPMYRRVRITECPTAILDAGLLFDRQHAQQGIPDFRHRERTFQNFVRMTTFIDPTPELANPRFEDSWVDELYKWERENDDGYTDLDIFKLELCLERDLPLGGFTNFDVGHDDWGMVLRDPLNMNYSTPIYGIKVIVTVFYLTGEAEMQLLDVDADGVVEEVPVENYGGARHVSLERTFYNDSNLNGFLKEYPPPRRFVLSDEGSDDSPARSLTIPDVDDSDSEDSDPCDINHNGLPYLTD